MASDAIAATSWWSRAVGFVQGAAHEIRAKTTWPDAAQIRQASIAIIIFVLLIGMVISLLDLVLNSILVRLLPSLFT